MSRIPCRFGPSRFEREYRRTRSFVPSGDHAGSSASTCLSIDDSHPCCQKVPQTASRRLPPHHSVADERQCDAHVRRPVRVAALQGIRIAQGLESRCHQHSPSRCRNNNWPGLLPERRWPIRPGTTRGRLRHRRRVDAADLMDRRAERCTSTFIDPSPPVHTAHRARDLFAVGRPAGYRPKFPAPTLARDLGHRAAVEHLRRRSCVVRRTEDVGVESDPLAIRRPDRVRIGRRADGQVHLGCAIRIHRPDVAAARRTRSCRSRRGTSASLTPGATMGDQQRQGDRSASRYEHAPASRTACRRPGVRRRRPARRRRARRGPAARSSAAPP